jgi:hypothetical protein
LAGIVHVHKATVCGNHGWQACAVGCYDVKTYPRGLRGELDASRRRPPQGDAAAMGAEQQFAQRMIFALAATLIMLATSVSAYSEQPLFSPNPLLGSGQLDQTQLPETSSSAIKQDSASTPWAKVPQAFSPRRSFGADVDKNTGETPADQFRLGNSYIGVQTQKSVQTPDPLRRSDCAKDDDCTNYPGSPQFAPPRTTVKSLRKPFIGLSITAPLRE